MSDKRVVVVVLNWNGFDDTVDCLTSLASVPYPHLQTVLVDNGSANDEAERLARLFPAVHVVANETNTGFTGGCNRGVEAALSLQADYVLLLNNDVVVRPNFLGALVEAAEQQSPPGVVGPLITYSGTDTLWFAGGVVREHLASFQHIGKGQPLQTYANQGVVNTHFITGCALMAGAELWRAMRGLPDDYFAYVEDIDFCLAARRAGHPVQLVTDAVVEHKKSASAGIRGSSRISPLQAYLWGRNNVIFAKRNMSGIRRIRYLLSTLIFRQCQAVSLSPSARTMQEFMGGFVDGLKGRTGKPPMLQDPSSMIVAEESVA